MAKNLMDYISKKYRDRIESVVQLPDYWDEEEERYRHQYKITCNEGWAFDAGGSIDSDGYVDTVSWLNKWIKEFTIKVG